MLITEAIAGVKGTIVKGKEMYIVTTKSGKTIWVMKSAFDNSAETISYTEMKKGDKYLKKGVNGAPDQELELKEDRNEFVGAYKQTKADNAVAIYTALNSLGIVPAIAL